MTMTEIAKIAGVSVASVSRFINGGSLSQEKRQIIQRVMDEYHYVPDSAAHIMKSGGDYVGLIVTNFSSNASAQLVSGATSFLERAGFLTVLGETELKREKELEYLALFQKKQVAGIIMQASVLTPELHTALQSISVPVVVVGQSFRQVPCVYHDDFGAAYELTNLMLSRGRKKLAYIGVILDDNAVGRNRLQGVQSAMEEFGVPVKALVTEICNPTVEAGEAAMKKLLRSAPDLDGVVCATDYLAFGALDALRSAGKRVPEDIGIAGMGDYWVGTRISPQLTTVHFYHKESGQKAANMLAGMIRSEETTACVHQIMLGYQIQERESV